MSENTTTELYFEELFEAVNSGNRELFRELFLALHERDQQELFHLLYPENKRKIAELLTYRYASNLCIYKPECRSRRILKLNG